MSLGADLSKVRVHTGSESAEAPRAVGARGLYYQARDIHFGAGQYAPADPVGVRLLAHEVAHTVQNRGGASERQEKLEVSTPGDSAEVEAERAADAIVAGASIDINGAATTIHRDDAQPPPDTTGPQPNPVDVSSPPAPGAATTTSTPPTTAGDQVTAQWKVDWVGRRLALLSPANLTRAQGEMQRTAI